MVIYFNNSLYPQQSCYLHSSHKLFDTFNTYVVGKFIHSRSDIFFYFFVTENKNKWKTNVIVVKSWYCQSLWRLQLIHWNINLNQSFVWILHTNLIKDQAFLLLYWPLEIKRSIYIWHGVTVLEMLLYIARKCIS